MKEKIRKILTVDRGVVYGDIPGLIADLKFLVNQEVEKRIAERMPRRDELIDEAQKVSKIKLSEREKALIRVTYRVIRSRLSQKTEGGGE